MVSVFRIRPIAWSSLSRSRVSIPRSGACTSVFQAVPQPGFQRLTTSIVGALAGDPRNLVRMSRYD